MTDAALQVYVDQAREVGLFPPPTVSQDMLERLDAVYDQVLNQGVTPEEAAASLFPPVESEKK